MIKIDFNKIIVGDISKLFTEEEIKKLKEIAAKERTELLKQVKQKNLYSLSRITKQTIYQKEEYTDPEKNFIYANILFPDSQKFLSVINSNNIETEYDYSSLNVLIDMLKYLKIKTRAKIPFTANDQKVYNYCITSITRMIPAIENKIGHADFEPIITKIAELISSDRHLFEQNNKEEIKYLRKNR